MTNADQLEVAINNSDQSEDSVTVTSQPDEELGSSVNAFADQSFDFHEPPPFTDATPVDEELPPFDDSHSTDFTRSSLDGNVDAAMPSMGGHLSTHSSNSDLSAADVSGTSGLDSAQASWGFTGDATGSTEHETEGQGWGSPSEGMQGAEKESQDGVPEIPDSGDSEKHEIRADDDDWAFSAPRDSKPTDDDWGFQDYTEVRKR